MSLEAATYQHRVPADPRPFAYQLPHMLQSQNYETLKNLGGTDGLLRRFGTNQHSGLSSNPSAASSSTGADSPQPHNPESEITSLNEEALPHGTLDDRRRVYGLNTLPVNQSITSLELLWMVCKNKVPALLCIATVISLALRHSRAFLIPRSEQVVDWVDGLAIVVSVFITVFVESVNDWQKHKRFKAFFDQKGQRGVKVIRDGMECTINTKDLLVGDIAILEPGEIIPCDGVFLSGHGIKCDESGATGESDAIIKLPFEVCLELDTADLKRTNCYIISGSKVIEGVGRYVVVAVGINSYHGRIMTALRSDLENPPWTNLVARKRSAAILLFTILLIQFFSSLWISGRSWPEKSVVFATILVIGITSQDIALPTKWMTYRDRLTRRASKSCDATMNSSIVHTDVMNDYKVVITSSEGTHFHPQLIWKIEGNSVRTDAGEPSRKAASDVSKALMPLRKRVEKFTRFRRFSSQAETPSMWIKAYKVDVKKLRKLRLGSTSWAPNDGVLVFERFIRFIQARTGVARALSERIVVWKTWDIIKLLSQYDSIIAQLSRLYPMSDEVCPIIELDIDAIAVQLYLVCKHPEQRTRLVNLEGDEAQGIVDLLHMLLERPCLDPLFRSPFFNALLCLSVRSGCYPEALVQQDLTFKNGHFEAGGGYSEVATGLLRGQQVAVKVLRLTSANESYYVKAAVCEAMIWRYLWHPNILRLLCLHRWNGKIALVSPWMSNGNMRDYLWREQNVNRRLLVLDIIKAIYYLHTQHPAIIHRDLKAVNILISAGGRAYLADFGLSRSVDHDVSSLSAPSGTLRWMAPELFGNSGNVGTEKTDIYAFACVCFEIFSGCYPFPDIHGDIAVPSKVLNGERPPRPDVCEPWKCDTRAVGLDDRMWNIIEACWSQNPEQRPTAEEVISLLSG